MRRWPGDYTRELVALEACAIHNFLPQVVLEVAKSGRKTLVVGAYRRLHSIDCIMLARTLLGGSVSDLLKYLGRVPLDVLLALHSG